MATISTNLSRTFNGIETAELFITPAVKGLEWLDIMRVMPDVVSKQQLNFRGKASKIIQKMTTCNFNAKGGVTLTDKELDVTAIKVDFEECVEDIASTIFEQEWAKKGTPRPDLTGTMVEQLMRELIIEGVRRDNARVLWWSQSGAGNADFNFFDGFWEQILDGTASLDCDLDLSSVETGGALDSDAAFDTFTQLVRDASSPLLEFGKENLALWVSRGLADNYRETLRNTSTSFGTEMIIGGVPRMAFDGIRIVEVPEWDTDMADANNPITSKLNTTSNNAAILSFADNFIVGTDAIGAAKGTDARIWYSMDDDVTRAKLRYKLGCKIAFLSLICAAY